LAVDRLLVSDVNDGRCMPYLRPITRGPCTLSRSYQSVSKLLERSWCERRML